MPQAVRQPARPGHAPAHPQPVPQVRGVREGVLPALVAAGPHALPHRREAVRLRPLREKIRGPVQPASSHEDSQEVKNTSQRIIIIQWSLFSQTMRYMTDYE